MQYIPKSYWDDEDWMQSQQITNVTVHQDEFDSFTGLYDHEGNPLYREPNKIGFI